MDTQSITRSNRTTFATPPPQSAATNTDPRAANCRGFLVDQAGNVIGIQLVHVPFPSAAVCPRTVEMLDEYQAQGNTVVTGGVALNADGYPDC